ncbi:hypothetical protein FPV67DRAFT_386889 [Lyophyllum atratum]|nr:hypothetical protein FPV67DRAFT_386889 [Lyophyllum atratum]
MPCIWSTTARSAFRSLARPSSAIAHTLHKGTPQYTCSLSWDYARTTRAFSQVARALPQSLPTQPIDLPTPPITPTSKITPAQTSRAACHAVHLALRTPVGGLEDAFLIVNSLRYSTLKHDPAAHLIPAVRDFHHVAVNFGHTVPPRLSSHALLHGLIRMGRKQQAADLAVSMMEAGIPLRIKTLETFMRTLVPPPPHVRRKSIPPLNFFTNPRGLGDIVAMARHPNSRLALEIFSVAHKTHRSNARGMLGTLLAICLINTEIILASLIFAFVVKEWQLRSAVVARFDASESVGTAHVVNKRIHEPHFQQERIVPTHDMLVQIVQAIKKIFETKNADAESLGTALQALANLAVLLDHRQIPFAAITPLIRTLYHCPRVDQEVWIVDANGKEKQVCAYTYCHDVLERLITNLPLKLEPKTPLPRSRSMLDRRPMLPPLDRHACNTLLHYSLRHLVSSTHADTILKHMVIDRTPRVEPDTTTYNILLRSATLLQDSGIAEAALTALASDAAGKSADACQETTVARLIETLRTLDLTKATKAETEKLLYSLTTQLMHYTSTGRPHIVAALIYDLFPELRLSLTASQYSPLEIKQRKKARRGMVVRASRYGSHLFSVLLNALLKAGKPGMAKAVWGVAKRAERMSWDGLNPWVLGTHTYTSMLRCCALEYKMGCNARAVSRGVDVQGVRRKALLVGWSHYRAMKEVGEEVRGVLVDSGREYRMERVGELPQIDALFVNAALDLFVLSRRPPGALPSEEEVRREFEEAKVRLAESGEVAGGWTPVLQEIGEDIVKAGFTIPPSLRHIFLGRWEEGARKREGPPHLGPIPYAYPDGRPSFHPFIVPSIRTRGLPLGRRQHFFRRKTRRRTRK